MPKLKNVTNEDIAEALQMVEAAHFRIMDLADTVRKGYVDPIDMPITYAKGFSSLSMAASDMATAILITASMDENRKNIEVMLKGRIE